MLTNLGEAAVRRQPTKLTHERTVLCIVQFPIHGACPCLNLLNFSRSFPTHTKINFDGSLNYYVKRRMKRPKEAIRSATILQQTCRIAFIPFSTIFKDLFCGSRVHKLNFITVWTVGKAISTEKLCLRTNNILRQRPPLGTQTL